MKGCMSVFLGSGLVFLGVYACDPPNPPETEEAAKPFGSPITIHEDPAWVIGEVEGDSLYELHEVAEMSFTSSGAVLVPLRGTSDIRIFDPDFGVVRSHGRQGEGPGEFASLGHAFARGDTTEAFDFRLQRVTRFEPDGGVELVDFRELEERLDGAVGLFGDGWLVWEMRGDPIRNRGLSRDELVLHKMSPSGDLEGRITSIRGMNRKAYENAPYALGPGPFSPSPRMEVQEDTAYVAATVDRVIGVYDEEGKRVRDIPIPLEPEMTLDEAKETIGSKRPELAAWVDEADVQEGLPRFSDLKVDPVGYIWLRTYRPGRDAVAVGGAVAAGPVGPGGSWVVLEPDGSVVDTVDAPGNLEIHEVGEDQVVGVYRNSHGVEFVRGHRLERRSDEAARPPQ